MITLRRDWAGGDPRPHVGDRSAFVRRHRKIWLIHGFNNSEAEARQSLSAFSRGLSYYRRNISEEIAHIFWPGDARMPYFRAVAYPSCLKKALTCSRELAAFFHAEKGDDAKPTELVIIAHSMGCRLAIEAIDQLYGMEGNQARKISVFFFAPAIPTTVIADLMKSPRFGDANLSCCIFHSAADIILRAAFPAGQFLGEMRLGPVRRRSACMATRKICGEIIPTTCTDSDTATIGVQAISKRRWRRRSD